MKLLLPCLTLLLLLLPTGCTTEGPSAEQTQLVNSIFSDAVTEFAVHVFYEPGAEPYTGNIGLSGNDTWKVTEESYKSLFEQHTSRSITVPSMLAEMTALDEQGKSTWTAQELIGLMEGLAPALLADSKINVTIVFLNGQYDNQSTVLGVHFEGQRFAFVFKDVVQSAGGTAADQRYVEQGTVVHELGHVVGFVDNGVPMVENHEDQEHPKHTTNSDCVMYWTVESSDQILGAITNLITANRLNLFEAEVLRDGRAYHP